jgi:ketosteroid isomerase-like protein
LVISGVANLQGQGGKPDPSLTKIAEAFIKAFNAKDAKAVAAFYTEDAVLMPPNVPLVKGRAAIHTYFEGLFKQGITDLRLSPIEARVSGQHAFDAGTSSLQIKPGNPSGLLLTGVGGGGAVRSDGKYVVIYKRVQGEWKIAYDIFNDDKPPTP